MKKKYEKIHTKTNSYFNFYKRQVREHLHACKKKDENVAKQI